MAASKGVVFAVKDDLAHRREVVYGMREGDLLEIRSGLNVGDLIVRGGQEKLSDGQKVAVAAPSEGQP